MSNKIDTYGPQIAPQTARVKSAETGGTSGGGRISGTQPSDSVKLTGEAVRLQQLERALADIPDVNLQRVAEIRAQLQDGTYRIDPQAVAARLARMEWELTH